MVIAGLEVVVVIEIAVVAVEAASGSNTERLLIFLPSLHLPRGQPVKGLEHDGYSLTRTEPHHYLGDSIPGPPVRTIRAEHRYVCTCVVGDSINRKNHLAIVRTT